MGLREVGVQKVMEVRVQEPLRVQEFQHALVAANFRHTHQTNTLHQLLQGPVMPPLLEILC